MNLEELVRAALAEEARAEPSEAGAYDRFARRRQRDAWRAAASAGLAVALVLALVIGGVWALRGLGGDPTRSPPIQWSVETSTSSTVVLASMATPRWGVHTRSVANALEERRLICQAAPA